MSDRRQFLVGGVAAFAAACTQAAREIPTPAPVANRSAVAVQTFAKIEASAGGRLGIAAIDLNTGTQVGHRGSQRFAMCSTFKWLLAATVLAAVDAEQLSLLRQVTFGEKDLLEYAPTTRANLAAGRLTVEELTRATIVNSDNTAANLLLPLVGGPAGVTAFARKHGDSVTRLDRDEPTLNTNLPDDPRDTTAPDAMAGLMKAVLTDASASAPLKHDSRDRLVSWLIACETGRERLRAGLPTDWRVGDKTGTGERSAVNDVAIVWPPRRAPIIIAAFMSDSGRTPTALNASHAAIARAVVEWAG